MSSARASTAGSTRACPHCKATILQSAAVCPNCRGHLRYDSAAVAGQSTAASTPLRVEGTVRHPGGTGALEYTMLLTIRNQRGEEVARQLVGVALKGEEEDARRMRFYVDSVVRERARTSAHWKDFFTAAQGLWQ